MNTTPTNTTATMAWIAAGAKNAGMRTPTHDYTDRAVAHLKKWAALTAAAVTTAEKRLTAEAAEEVPFPPVYGTAENYRARTQQSAREGAVRGIWTPYEIQHWRATPDQVLEEWGISRTAVEAAIR